MNVSFFILILMTGFLLQSNDQWEFEKEEDHVTVFTKKTSQSPFKETRAVTKVNSKISSLEKILREVDKYPQWVHKCKEARIVKEVNNREWISYLVIDSPWPVPDRDVVISFSLDQKDRGMVITMNDTSGILPEQADYTRIDDLTGLWRIETQDQGELVIDYSVHVDPGGKTPAVLANKAAVQLPFQTLVNLRENMLNEN